MKKYCVYVLMNDAGIIEYVGETFDTVQRMRCHRTTKGRKFCGRKDLTLEVVKEFDNRDDAKEYEGELKLQLGFEWTEKTTIQKNGKIQGRKNVESGHILKCNQRMKELYSQPIVAYRKDTYELVGEFTSLNEAAKLLGVHVGNIAHVLSGKYKQTGGYTFKKI